MDDEVVEIDADIDDDIDAIIAELKDNPAVVAALEWVAQEGAAYWQSIAPVGDPDLDWNAGDYVSSIEVEADGSDVYVIAQDPAANIIEYGNATTPEFACRARTEAYMNAQQ